MELPIDHFRLLGVSSSAGAEEILRVFQLRLDRAPGQGFTRDVLAQRAEMLRLSADLLTDQSLRTEYEQALSQGASGLDLSSNRDVAGLILLWEADGSSEAFQLARKALQPPQTPALGSSREADLTLIAALSCRDAALKQQDQRHYSIAADLLQEGIQLLQRMGKLPDQRQNLEQDLEALLPFRILDLLSRDLEDTRFRQEGLTLLDSFVSKRGGLEGRNKLKRIGGLSQTDFEIFFQQIRGFLSVQEQVDNFVNWYREGSADSGFLAAIALVASGFVLKEPERLQEARKYLKNLNYQGLDPMPLIGCIDLLLGDVKQAEARFLSSTDIGLKNWLESYPGEGLAAYCHYCRNWLQNDVLQGYRDIQIKYVDLDNWFSDQGVQEYLENLENKGARGLARAGRTFFSSFASEKGDEGPSAEPSEPEGNLPMPGGLRPGASDEEGLSLLERNLDNELESSFIENFIEAVQDKFTSLNFAELKEQITSRNPIIVSAFAFILLFISGTAIGLISLRTKPSKQTSLDKNTQVQISTDKKADVLKGDKLDITPIDNISKKIKEEKFRDNENSFEPLTVENPNEKQIESLIKAWLNSKAKTLAGEDVGDLSGFVKKPLANRLLKERSKDIKSDENQIINAKIKSIDILSRTNKRIAVNVDLNYKDQRIKSSGEIVTETLIPSLKVVYVLGREKDTWLLVDYISGG